MGIGRSSRRHAAVFVRQGDLEHATSVVRGGREEAIRRRWQRCGVEPVFVDHYSDAAQLLYEIGYRRDNSRPYEPVAARAARTIRQIERTLFVTDASDDAFAERQVDLSSWLRSHLYTLLATALDGGRPPGDERLALALWLLSPDGASITGWAHSDRAHQDPATVEAVPIAAGSEWVAVRTVCRGACRTRSTEPCVALAVCPRAAADPSATDPTADRMRHNLLHEVRGGKRAQQA